MWFSLVCVLFYPAIPTSFFNFIQLFLYLLLIYYWQGPPRTDSQVYVHMIIHVQCHVYNMYACTIVLLHSRSGIKCVCNTHDHQHRNTYNIIAILINTSQGWFRHAFLKKMSRQLITCRLLIAWSRPCDYMVVGPSHTYNNIQYYDIILSCNLHEQNEDSFRTTNCSVKFADVSTRCSSHPQGKSRVLGL